MHDVSKAVSVAVARRVSVSFYKSFFAIVVSFELALWLFEMSPASDWQGPCLGTNLSVASPSPDYTADGTRGTW